MSGLFRGSAGMATAPTKLAGIQVQTSAYGTPIPLVYGMNRVAGNLIWSGDFVATAVKSSTPSGGGGKGGGQVQSVTQYTYTSAVAIALCEGPIQSLGGIWDNNGHITTTTVTEEFTVPAGGGTITVANAANFSADFGVTQTTTYPPTPPPYGDPGTGDPGGEQDTPMRPVL